MSAAAHDSTRRRNKKLETMTDSTNMVKSNSGTGTGTGSASGFTYENFHLDPQDFQNFLLITSATQEW